jgi:hypothetical protein
MTIQQTLKMCPRTLISPNRFQANAFRSLSFFLELTALQSEKTKLSEILKRNFDFKLDLLLA